MLYHVDQTNTSALALSKSDPNTVIFKESYIVGKVETDAVVGKLRECKGSGKGRTARAPAPRRKVAPRKKSVPAPIPHAPRPHSRRGAQIQTSHTAQRRGAWARRKAPIRKTPTMGGTPRMRMWMMGGRGRTKMRTGAGGGKQENK